MIYGRFISFIMLGEGLACVRFISIAGFAILRWIPYGTWIPSAGDAWLV